MTQKTNQTEALALQFLLRAGWTLQGAMAAIETGRVPVAELARIERHGVGASQ